MWTRVDVGLIRWTDTDKDPYSAHRGFFFSHLGWMLVQRPKNRIGYADVADLKADPVVTFQHKHYPYFALIMGFLFPMFVAGLGWGDFRVSFLFFFSTRNFGPARGRYWRQLHSIQGGFYYAGVLRLCFVHHATFCVNSLAHYLGEDTFDDHHTPRDHWITALVTMGEGYHNFHHEFPQDYRNAIVYYQYDPTKWLIKLLSFTGLAYDLKTFPANEVTKGKIQMQEKKIMAIKKQLQYGTKIEDLPVFTWDEYQDLVNKQDKKWILIEGILYDMEEFINEHPGGEKYIRTGLGKDMTTAFNGGVYNHSNGARNLLTRMRVGVLKNGMEVMSEKKAQ